MDSDIDLHELRYAVCCLRFGVVPADRVQEALAAFRQQATPSVAQRLLDEGVLSPELHSHVRALLEAHLKSNNGDAQASLRSLTDSSAGDGDVTRLLDNGEQTVDFDSGQVVGMGDTVPLPVSKVASTASGDRFLKLVKHRQGGMGEVFRARDVQINRMVALKQLRDHFVQHDSYRDRFVFEGQVTGALEHPGIVPVYAMGENEESQPYYVMRYIEGEAFSDAIRRFHAGDGPDLTRSSAEFRDLLSRFVAACHAIEYAHSRGVLHRDLKPDNIMLGLYQETLVVDWGLAANQRAPSNADAETAPLIDSELASRREQTLAGSAVGTPGYMSPEQALGKIDQIGPATDVFNLGATLYHLLTNRPPFRGVDATTTLELAQRRELSPPRQVVPAVPPAIDAIALKAMALAPADRYASARELAEEVDRWIADERVLAAPEPFAERVFRWGRKNRGLAIASAASLLVLGVVASVAAVAVNQARREAVALAADNLTLAKDNRTARELAEQRFVESRAAVDTWLTGFSEASRYVPAVQGLRRELLQRAAAEYERFAAEGGDGLDLRIEQGRSLVRLAEVRRELGEGEAAVESLGAARALFQGLLDAGHDAPAIRLALADTHNQLAVALRGLGRLGEALASIERCLALTAASESDPEAAEIAAAALSNRGQIALQREADDRLDAAAEAFDGALALLDRLRAASPDSVRYLEGSAKAMLGKGRVLAEGGASDQAGEWYRRAVEAAGRAAAANPSNHDYGLLLANTHMFVASAAAARGDAVAETEAYAEAAEAFTRLVKALPDMPVFRVNLALVEMDRGQTLVEYGRAAAAEPVLVRALRILKPLAATNVPRYREAWALATDNLAHALLVAGKNDEAYRRSQEAVAGFAELVGRWPDEVDYQTRLAVAETLLAQVLVAIGEPEAANERFASAVERLTGGADGPTDPARRSFAALAASRWGAHLLESGGPNAKQRLAEAADHYRALAAASSDPRHQHAAAWFFLSCPDESLRDSLQALDSATAAVDATPQNARYLCTLARLRLQKEQLDAADRLLTRARSAAVEDDARVAFLLATLRQEQGERAESQRLLAAAQRWTKKNAPGDWDLVRLGRECEAALDAQPAGD